MTRRLALAPYVGQRLYAEGILIDINKPNKKNGHTFGLVFASITLPNEKLELDHVVIPVTKAFINKQKPVIFTKYAFTACVSSYTKLSRLQGVLVNIDAYQLKDINAKRFDKISAKKPKLSLFLENKLKKIDQHQYHHLNTHALRTILLKKNEGEREEYMMQLTLTLQKRSVTRADILNELYTSNRS